MGPPATQSNLASLLEKGLSAEVLSLLSKIAATADARHVAVHLVGGAVRDLLLAQPALDLDLVVEGDAPGLAQSLAEQIGGRAVIHHRFRTAKLYVKSMELDLVTARRERYGKPGALPRVQPGTIDDDLRRRDFTINALAVSLSRASFGEVSDPTNGRADLEAGLLRVIHDRSFEDDATRILRALRYQARFGFRLHPATASLLHDGAGYLDGISGTRVRHEIERILAEERPEIALELAKESGALAAIHPSLEGDGRLDERFVRARSMGLGRRDVYLALLGWPVTPEAARAVAQRLSLNGADANALLEAGQLSKLLPDLNDPELRPSDMARALEPYGETALAAGRVAADSTLIDERLLRYLDELRHVRPALGGSDLRKLGVPSGPQVGEALAMLTSARLDELVGSRQDEEALIARWLRPKAATR
jgi:tRNA nucleotidyltransferase (CCA-adding enzyme)